MIKKQALKSRPVCKLAFELPASVEADAVELLADFNNWRGEPFTRLKNGTWKLTQEVTPDQSYQFRYRLVQDGYSAYLNDEAADGYVRNDFGTENAIVRC